MGAVVYKEYMSARLSWISVITSSTSGCIIGLGLSHCMLPLLSPNIQSELSRLSKSSLRDSLGFRSLPDPDHRNSSIKYVGKQLLSSGHQRVIGYMTVRTATNVSWRCWVFRSFQGEARTSLIRGVRAETCDR